MGFYPPRIEHCQSMIGVQWRARDSKQTAVSGQGGVWNGVDLTRTQSHTTPLSFAFYNSFAQRDVIVDLQFGLGLVLDRMYIYRFPDASKPSVFMLLLFCFCD